MNENSKTRVVAREKAGPEDRWMVLGVCLFLFAITWSVFGQTLRHQFVNYDDGKYVFNNPHVTRGLTREGIVWAFTHVHASNWHPLTWLSHMLDCQLFGLNAGGHHLTNVLLHAATVISLFLVLRQLTGALWRSAFVAAVFAIHPLHVESVAWVAERKDVLSGLFFLLTIGAYAWYARGSWSLFRYGLVLLLFAMGLMCKPMLVTIPFVLLLLDYWPLDRLVPSNQQDADYQKGMRRLTLEKLPFVGLALASCAITLFAQRKAMQPGAGVPLVLRLGKALVSYMDYLRQLVRPVDLAVFYPYATRLRAWEILLSVIVLTAVSAGVFILRRRRYLVTGWLWYLIMLVPVIGIIQVGKQARADRYTYLPHIGLYILLTWGAVDLLSRSRFRRVLLPALASIILVSLTFLARAQVRYWRDGETLWSHALACTGSNVVAEGNLGQACYDKGKSSEAMLHLQNSLRLDPNQAQVQSSLGGLFLDLGQLDESLVHLQKALEIEPDFADAHYNLGNVYRQMKQPTEALSHYRKTLESNPDDAQALTNMAWMLATWPDASTRDGAKAVELAERADSITHGRNAEVNATLAAAYAEAGRFAEAIKAGERALELVSAKHNAGRADAIHAQIEAYRSGTAVRD